MLCNLTKLNVTIDRLVSLIFLSLTIKHSAKLASTNFKCCRSQVNLLFSSTPPDFQEKPDNASCI